MSQCRLRESLQPLDIDKITRRTEECEVRGQNISDEKNSRNFTWAVLHRHGLSSHSFSDTLALSLSACEIKMNETYLLKPPLNLKTKLENHNTSFRQRIYVVFHCAQFTERIVNWQNYRGPRLKSRFAAFILTKRTRNKNENFKLLFLRWQWK